MIKRYIDVTSGEFIMHENNPEFIGIGSNNSTKTLNTFVYNFGENQKVTIDGIEYDFPQMCFLPLIANQNFKFKNPEKVIAWQFNREFYWKLEYDSEIDIVSYLFYGISQPMFIKLNKEIDDEIKYLTRIFLTEWESNDRFQGEMLRTLLKHLIIKITRIAKLQYISFVNFKENKLDIVRKLFVLVELNYKKEHSVKFYADALNKSPKTLSNIFSASKEQAPSKIIYNRIILEAKKYLNYTDKTAKEIANELGFDDVSNFSRFFKRNTGINISNFKIEHLQNT